MYKKVYKNKVTHVKSICHPSRWAKADFRESGNGYKKTTENPNIQFTIIRATIKTFKTTGTVVNLPGRGPKCILSPSTVRKMFQEAKKCPRAIVGELQNVVTFWGHQASKSTIRQHLHAKRLLGRVAIKKPLLRATNKCKLLEFAKQHWIGIGCYG
jgi:hypothetical protein